THAKVLRTSTPKRDVRTIPVYTHSARVFETENESARRFDSDDGDFAVVAEKIHRPVTNAGSQVATFGLLGERRDRRQNQSEKCNEFHERLHGRFSFHHERWD